MSRELIGNVDRFAIEYEITLADSRHLWASFRFFVNGKFIGDIDCDSPIFNLVKRLVHVRKCEGSSRYIYDNRSGVRSFQEHIDRYGLHDLGEMFDVFPTWFYAIRNDRVVCFDWSKNPTPWKEFPNYPEGDYHEEVPMKDFDLVVDEFLQRLPKFLDESSNE